jgi:GT2 family glycosyltransferase
MINGEKIGVGIVTYKRPHLLEKLLITLLPCQGIIDEIIVVDDGGDLNPEDFLKESWMSKYGAWNTNSPNLGVGKSKNIALNYLQNCKCDHIFLFEDDIFVKNPEVFTKYIEASKVTGIQHFNFSQHGIMNKTFDALHTPNPRTTISYGEVNVSLYPHCVGAFSYYSKRCLDAVGLIDERYFNACEHVDHTYEIIKAGMHPPFWYFADIDKSWEYLGDEEWSLEKSTISSNPKHKQMMQDADHIFVKKHGHYPGQITLVDFTEVGKILRNIKNNYGANLTNV